MPISPIGVSRLAVVLDRPWLRAWQREALLLAQREMEVRVYALSDERREPEERRNVIVRAFDALDRLRTRGRFRRRFDATDAGLDWVQLPGGPAARAALERAAEESDALLDFTGDPLGLAGSLTRRPRLGIWFFASGRAAVSDGAGVALEPLRRRARTAAVSLVALDEHDRPRRCWRTEVRTHPTSPAITEERMLDTAIPSLVEGLRRIGRAGSLERAHAEIEAPPAARAAEALAVPMIGRILLRTLANSFVPSGRSQWSVATLAAASFPPRPEELLRARWLYPGAALFLADPFLLMRGERAYVFVEEFYYDSEKGHISVMSLDGDGSLSAPRRVLETDFHLSFPFVFEHEGKAYMVPEQAERGEVVMYREVAFPDRWEQHRVLLSDFPGVDPVLHHDGQRWWLFVTYGGHHNYDNNLFLFYADHLDDEFTPHPGNPIKLDISGSRMAGQIHCAEGVRYRPAQNCATRYGGSVVFHRIDELTPTTYRETLVSDLSLPAGPFGDAFHTCNRRDDITVIDGSRVLRLAGPPPDRPGHSRRTVPPPAAR